MTKEFNLSEERKRLMKVLRLGVPKEKLEYVFEQIMLQDKEFIKRLKEELKFEGINLGDFDWKTLKEEFVRSFSSCESKEDLERELKRIVGSFKIDEKIDKLAGDDLK